MKFIIIKLYYKEIISIYIIAATFIFSCILGINKYLKFQKKQKEKANINIEINKISKKLNQINYLKKIKINKPKKEQIKIESYLNIAQLELNKYTLFFTKEFNLIKKCDKQNKNCRLYLKLYGEGYTF